MSCAPSRVIYCFSSCVIPEAQDRALVFPVKYVPSALEEPSLTAPIPPSYSFYNDRPSQTYFSISSLLLPSPRSPTSNPFIPFHRWRRKPFTQPQHTHLDFPNIFSQFPNATPPCLADASKVSACTILPISHLKGVHLCHRYFLQSLNRIRTYAMHPAHLLKSKEGNFVANSECKSCV